MAQMHETSYPGPDPVHESTLSTDTKQIASVNNSSRIRLRRDHIMDELLSCINVAYAYERRAFKHQKPEGGGLTDSDIASLQAALEASFETFFIEKFKID